MLIIKLHYLADYIMSYRLGTKNNARLTVKWKIRNYFLISVHDKLEDLMSGGILNVILWD